MQLLQTLFPEVQRRYAEAAALGRDFYDSQRALHHPELPRHEMLRSELQFKWFVKNMEPARKEMSRVDTPKSAVTKMALTAVREVEMAPRRQIIGAINNDIELEQLQSVASAKSFREVLNDLARSSAPETIPQRTPSLEPVEQRVVRGWARVATGRETCAWCLMMISRGPKYIGTDSAGLRLDEETVVDLFREAGGDLEKFRDEVDDHMEEWHAGCDCLVVPVFDVENWPGKAAQVRAEQLWIDATKEARKLIDAGKSRSKNLNLETQNALRRRLYSGELSMSNYALAA
ncbi:hypothetical protein MycrhDRAFT_6895 [Mycolicibacterium rhodesiae JS60]|nr:hypothetical protein MycrhDRAFT_6895 [Mycolicibacterium rhodesiae JS60]